MTSRVPLATYRLQFNRQFRFEDACRQVPYLKRLGVSDLYASPLFAARAGSMHGYDVIDPTRLNPELGSEAEFAALVAELRRHGMGLVLDIVPNHMAASTENPWWTDVLEYGAASPYAGFFDIAWHRTAADGPGRMRVLLPILGAPYGRELERGALKLEVADQGLVIRYYDNTFPVTPRSYRIPLGRALDQVERTLGHSLPAVGHLRDILTGLRHLDPLPPADGDAARWLSRAGELKRRALDAIQHPEIRDIVDSSVVALNGRAGVQDSFDPLDALLEEQAYRLAYWRVASERINYRRFFDISDLVGLRVEDPRVFDATHALILSLVRRGAVAGLRVDHVDGLADPTGYLHRLVARAAEAARAGGQACPYVVVEKILGHDESLQPSWPVAGTTGYDFLNAVNAVFVDPDGLARLGTIYQRFAGWYERFPDIAYASKRQVIEQLFAGEFRAAAEQLARIAATDRYARDLSREELGQALIEVTACMPVYRTYSREVPAAAEDRARVDEAVAEATRRNPGIEPDVFQFVRRVLSLLLPRSAGAEKRDRWLRFAQRWQQISGAVLAKGLEDTAFYRFNRLISLDEVGGDPDDERDPVAGFHACCQRRQIAWPNTLNASATHDTKRGEDVRARLDVLSEMPDHWERALSRWSKWNYVHKSLVDETPVPDANEEVLIYQTLLGSWPLDEAEHADFLGRICAYLTKAMREAKVHTSWLAPNQDHEEAVLAFVRALLEPAPENRFLDDFMRLQRRLALPGAVNGLAQVLLKLTAPGVPDVYRGTEFWDLSLADPDNRRPVDFGARAEALAVLRSRGRLQRGRSPGDLLRAWRDGRIKLYLLERALALRTTHPDLFQSGEYVPLYAEGPRAGHVLAFARRRGDAWAVVVVPRLTARLTRAGLPPLGARVWSGTTLSLPSDAPAVWRDALAGGSVQAEGGQVALPLSWLLQVLPIALLFSR